MILLLNRSGITCSRVIFKFSYNNTVSSLGLNISSCSHLPCTRSSTSTQNPINNGFNKQLPQSLTKVLSFKAFLEDTFKTPSNGEMELVVTLTTKHKISPNTDQESNPETLIHMNPAFTCSCTYAPAYFAWPITLTVETHLMLMIIPNGWWSVPVIFFPQLQSHNKSCFGIHILQNHSNSFTGSKFSFPPKPCRKA